MAWLWVGIAWPPVIKSYRRQQSQGQTHRPSGHDCLSLSLLQPSPFETAFVSVFFRSKNYWSSTQYLVVLNDKNFFFDRIQMVGSAIVMESKKVKDVHLILRDG